MAPAGLGATMRSIVRQAWPVLVSQWAGIAFGVLDTTMTGHASPRDLAAMSLSASVFITVFVGLMGVIHALIPIAAQQYGAGRPQEVGHVWGQGVWLALGLSVVGGVLMCFPDMWLAFPVMWIRRCVKALPGIYAPSFWRCPARWCFVLFMRWARQCRGPKW
ncbi:matE family protein [Bordetella holmesii 70147]|nr:matE family protein [Bordetella holmesii 70147]